MHEYKIKFFKNRHMLYLKYVQFIPQYLNKLYMYSKGFIYLKSELEMLFNLYQCNSEVFL